MTLIIKPGQVSNTKTTELSVGGQVKVGGSFDNSGSIRVNNNGQLIVNKDVLNTGDLTISEPERMKEMLVEIVKTTGNVAELGTQVLKSFFGVTTL